MGLPRMARCLTADGRLRGWTPPCGLDCQTADNPSTALGDLIAAATTHPTFDGLTSPAGTMEIIIMGHVAVLFFVLGLPGLAIAAEAGPCARSMPQQDMNVCISNAVQQADGILNRVYGQLNEKLDVNGRRNLVAAERAWITFRDRECDLRSGYDTEHPENNGTIAPFLVGECQLDLTTRRTTDILEQMKCPGGDLSCPQ